MSQSARRHVLPLPVFRGSAHAPPEHEREPVVALALRVRPRRDGARLERDRRQREPLVPPRRVLPTRRHRRAALRSRDRRRKFVFGTRGVRGRLLVALIERAVRLVHRAALAETRRTGAWSGQRLLFLELLEELDVALRPRWRRFEPHCGHWEARRFAWSEDRRLILDARQGALRGVEVYGHERGGRIQCDVVEEEGRHALQAG